MQIKTVRLDGKYIAYTDETEFLVQMGMNQGSFKSVRRFVGDIHAAAKYYQALKVREGYKKRLFAPSFNKPVLARYVHEWRRPFIEDV